MVEDSTPATARQPSLLQKLRDHFDMEPATLPVVEQSFARHDRPNLHLALEEMLGQDGVQSEIVGVVTLEQYYEPTLAHLSREAAAKHFDEGPVEYTDEPLPGGRQLACVKRGLFLIRIEDQPVALLITRERYSHAPNIVVEVMASERGRAEHFVRQLTRRTRHGKA
jgi:hypothetical protein